MNEHDQTSIKPVPSLLPNVDLSTEKTQDNEKIHHHQNPNQSSAATTLTKNK